MSTIDRYYTMPMPTDPGSTDDVHMGCHVGSRWVNVNTKRAFVCTDATANNAVWYQVSIPSAFYETVACNLTTANREYQVAQSFPFIGTSKVVLESISVIAVQSGGDSNVTFDIRIHDVTNNTTIAEITGLNAPTKGIFSVGSLSNLPSGQAVFDLEIRRSGTVSNDTATVFTFIIKHY